jgi:peroxiredoxin Q/BCP
MASTDSPEDNKAFAEKNEASFPILSDPSKEACDAYGVVSAMGYAKRWTFYIGPEGKILKIDKDVDVRQAGVNLVSHLEELRVPRVQD